MAPETTLNSGLSEEILADFRRIGERFPKIQRLLIFGSRAKGTYKPYSDIDLAVVAPDMTSNEFAAVWDAFNSLPLVFKLDVLHWDTIDNPRLKEKIMRDSKPVYNITQKI